MALLVIAGFGRMFLASNTSQINSQNLSGLTTSTNGSQQANSTHLAVDPNSANNSNSGQNYTPMQSTSQLFSDTADFQSAYLIWPGAPSADAQTALDGFNLNSQNLGNNVYKIILTATDRNYHNQSFAVAGNDKIYFVEYSLGDDAPGRDYALGDDYAVAVDSNGYILK